MATAKGNGAINGQAKKHKWAAFQQLFAGISAGVVTTVCTHPLDLIKTRLQCNIVGITYLIK
jgi:Mitochondrial carrier protein